MPHCGTASGSVCVPQCVCVCVCVCECMEICTCVHTRRPASHCHCHSDCHWQWGHSVRPPLPLAVPLPVARPARLATARDSATLSIRLGLRQYTHIICTQTECAADGRAHRGGAATSGTGRGATAPGRPCTVTAPQRPPVTLSRRMPLRLLLLHPQLPAGTLVVAEGVVLVRHLHGDRRRCRRHRCGCATDRHVQAMTGRHGW